MVRVCACQLKWKCNQLFLKEENWYWLCEGGLSARCCCLVEFRSNTDLETTRCLTRAASLDGYTGSLAACIRVAETVKSLQVILLLLLASPSTSVISVPSLFSPTGTIIKKKSILGLPEFRIITINTRKHLKIMFSI